MTLKWAHLWLCNLSLQLQLVSLSGAGMEKVESWQVCLFFSCGYMEGRLCRGIEDNCEWTKIMNHEQSEDMHRNREERLCKGSRNWVVSWWSQNMWGSELGKKKLGSQVYESWNWSFAFLFRQYSWRVAWFKSNEREFSALGLLFCIFSRLFNQFPHLSKGNFCSF